MNEPRGRPAPTSDGRDANEVHPFVAGIGWSAGGLEALEAFAAGIPPDAQLAYVVVGRPDAPADLADRLARIAPIPVRAAQGGARVAAGHLHVVPPDARVELDAAGTARIDRVEGRAPTFGLDRFLSELADVLGASSAGVVLAGTGRDGALGLQAIRAAGGLALAQDPDTARFDELPSAALSLGSVDLIRSPEGLGPELERLARDAHRGSTALQRETDAMDQILSAVRDETGLDFGPYKRTSLARRVGRRMALNERDDLESYLAFTRDHPEELTQLARDVLVSVTRFFRDGPSFQALRAALDERVTELRSDEPFRVWVPACASGEEAYSVAMCLAESRSRAQEHPDFIVYGTDVDPRSVERARRGRYSAIAVEQIDPQLRSRYFRPDDGGFVVSEQLRDRMVFAPQDILRDPPFSQLDLVTCRNLLIYLQPSAQADLMRIFHYALRPGGLLFLGKSESVGAMEHLFAPVSKTHRIFRRLDGPGEPYRRGRGRAFPSTNDDRAVRRREGMVISHRDAVAHVLADWLDCPALLVDDRRELLYVRGDISELFSLAEGDANHNVIDLAVPDLRPPLRSALHRASRNRVPVSKTDLRVPLPGGRSRHLDLHALPVGRIAGHEGTLVVVLEHRSGPEASSPSPPSSDPGVTRIRELEAELAASQSNLQDAIEELESANAEQQSLNSELHAANEELQSTNEELETANEEYQAANEELSTVNDELRARTRELRATNAELESILDCVVTPLLVLDPELRLLRLSRAAGTLFGLSAAAIGSRLSGLPRHPLLEALLPDIEAVIRGDAVRSREVHDAGRVHVGEVAPIFDADDEPTPSGALVLVHDVTDSRRREREFAALADNAPDIVARFDREGRHLYVNRTLERFTGRPREEWVGRRNDELGLDPRVVEATESAVRQVFETGQGTTVEFDFEGVGGTYHFESRFVPERGGSGEVESVLTVARDVTREVEAQRALATEKERTEALLESISDGFFALDRDLVVTYLNDAAARLLRRERSSVLGRNLFDAFPEAAGSIFETRYTRALREGRPDAFESYFAPHDDWYEVRVYPSQEGLSVFFQVVTERKRAEEQQLELVRELHHAQKMQALGTLTGGIAHEFNNILMAILGFAEIAMTSPDLSSEASSDLEEVVTAAQRGRGLVNQILAFARKSVASPRPLDLNEPVRRVGRILDSTLPRRITVDLRLAEDLLRVHADPGQIEQVLLNLTSNASDAITENGTVTIETRNVLGLNPATHGVDLAPGDYVALSVRDDGYGMDDETLQRVFEPFFTTKEPGAGTGLGLSTAFGIVKGHRGHIVAQSEPGRGTRFTIYLPAKDEAPPAPHAPAARAEPRKGRNETVLVVDDEPALRQFYHRVLEPSGYRVLLAPSGEAALELFADYRDQVDLAVVDLGMPGIGGLECVTRLKAERAELRIIVATGYASSADAEEAKAAGARTVLPKPFRRNDLLDAIRDAIEAEA